MSVIYPKPENPPDPDADYREDEDGYSLPEEEAFYKHLSLAATLKTKFVTDVDRIVVENSLTRKKDCRKTVMNE